MNLKNKLSNDDFYLFHQNMGDKSLAEENYIDAIKHYKRSLEINPFNLLLISRVADIILKVPNTFFFPPFILDALKKALIKKGENSSVYEFCSSVSYVNKKIMQAHHVASPIDWSAVDRPISFSKPLRFVLLTCVWQRPALTEVILSYYQGVAKRLIGQIELVLLAVGSEGKISRQLCERYGFYYLEHENLPLSDKWEYGLKNARHLNPDAVITVGSDDLLSVPLFHSYANLLNEGYLFCGLGDGYFLDLADPERITYWKGYGGLNREQGMPWRLNETLGMGRMYSRLLLERVDYSLWQGKHVNKGLDGFAKERLFALGMLAVLKEHAIPILVNNEKILFGQVAMQMKDIGAVAVDIKSPGANVTDMSGYKKSKESFMIIDDSWGYLSKHFPKDTIHSLRDLLN